MDLDAWITKMYAFGNYARREVTRPDSFYREPEDENGVFTQQLKKDLKQRS